MSEAAAAAAADDMPTVTRWLVEAEVLLPGTRTLSWAAISLLLNVLFVLGWIVCSFFEVGMRWDLIGVMFSNGFGKLAKLPLPRPTRWPLYTLWGWIVKADLDEAEMPRSDYPNLSALFTRALKPGARPIGPGLTSPSDPAPLPASPAPPAPPLLPFWRFLGLCGGCGAALTACTRACRVDGTVIVYGDVVDGELQSIKGMSYSIAQFLGWSDSDSASIEAQRQLLARLARAGVAPQSPGGGGLDDFVVRRPEPPPSTPAPALRCCRVAILLLEDGCHLRKMCTSHKPRASSRNPPPA